MTRYSKTGNGLAIRIRRILEPTPMSLILDSHDYTPDRCEERRKICTHLLIHDVIVNLSQHAHCAITPQRLVKSAKSILPFDWLRDRLSANVSGMSQLWEDSLTVKTDMYWYIISTATHINSCLRRISEPNILRRGDSTAVVFITSGK